MAIGAIALLGIIAAGWLAGLRLNLTPSEPIGLWRIAPLGRPIAVGDLIFVCPPPGTISESGLERGYFHSGVCPSAAAPLIKTVAALPGTRVEVGSSLTIEGTPLPSSRLSSRDGEGRSLNPWPGGVIPPGNLFLHSAFVGSYDSRYFGPIPAAGVLGLAKPIFTWDP